MRNVAGELVERDAELAALAALLRNARAGEGGVLLLQGPPGIGKTALLDAAAGMASGVSVLRGRGGEVERELSFGLVRELFEPVMRAAPATSRRRWLSGAAGAASAVLGEVPEGEADAAAVTFGLYWLLAAIAEERPVLLIADDLHWCDPSSLRWLVYLARRIEGVPVALLAAARPAEPDEGSWVDHLVTAPGVRVFRPAALGPVATRLLIARGLATEPEDVFATACHDATGGNPWLLGELLDGVRDAGIAPTADSVRLIDELAGDRLRLAVPARLARLDAAAGALARAVAVLGDGCELRHAHALAGISQSSAVGVLPALIAAGVLADAQPLAFVHPLLRSAVYLDLAEPVRAAEHGRAAALLHGSNAGAEAVSHHLLAAEPVGEAWALAALTDAARTALARGAPESAVAYLRRALQERPERSERAALMRSLGNALARLGDPTALDVLEGALELAASPAERIGIVVAAADPLLASGRGGDARGLLLGALADADALDPELALTLAAQAGLTRVLGPSGSDEAAARLRASLPRLDASTPARRYAAGALALVQAVCDGTAEEAVRLARGALADTASVDEDARTGRPQHVARVALALAGEPEEALLGLERALGFSSARGSTMGEGVGIGWRALIQLLAGNVRETENDARAALAVLAGTGLSGPELGATAALAWALIERGELAEAADALAAAPPEHGWGGAAVGCVRARLLMARHLHREALVELDAVRAMATQAGWRSLPPVDWRALEACACLGSGDEERALQRSGEDLAAAQRFGSRRELGRALRVRGLVAGPEAQLAAIDCLRAAEYPLELARALVDHGAALRRAGERARSREPLLEGLELAAVCGASALVEQARTELRAAGARPRRVARSGLESLTPSERRVAALAAEGLSNAEVARALFVTVRTVEMHLSAVYRKLEIESRAALPGALST